MATAVIANIFATTQPVTVPIKLSLTLNPNDNAIPMNLMGSKFAESITLRCIAKTFKLRVNQDAFLTSRNFANIVSISNCDMAETNLAFMNGFTALGSLYLSTNVNLQSSLPTLPYPLPNLNYMNFYSSQGLNNIINFPTVLARGLNYIDLGTTGLDDGGASRILDWISKSSFNTLQTLYLDYNSLTHVPTQIPSLTALHALEISGNQISLLGTGAFRFTAPVTKILAAGNQIKTIQPGAFQGKFLMQQKFRQLF